MQASRQFLQARVTILREHLTTQSPYSFIFLGFRRISQVFLLYSRMPFSQRSVSWLRTQYFKPTMVCHSNQHLPPLLALALILAYLGPKVTRLSFRSYSLVAIRSLHQVSSHQREGKQLLSRCMPPTISPRIH